MKRKTRNSEKASEEILKVIIIYKCSITIYNKSDIVLLNKLRIKNMLILF